MQRGDHLKKNMKCSFACPSVKGDLRKETHEHSDLLEEEELIEEKSKVEIV